MKQKSPIHSLSSGIQPGQVLQRRKGRGADVVIQGTSAAEGSLHVTLIKGRAAVKGWKRKKVGILSGGQFSAALHDIPVGGPYQLQIECEGQLMECGPFYVGDVWILAGQSNMQGCARRPNPLVTHPLVHAFRMNRQWELAEDPIHLLEESPDHVHYDGPPLSKKEVTQLRRNHLRGGCVGVYFGIEMVQRTGGVPQGLICAAHGGTSMAQWSPKLKHEEGNSLYGSLLASVRATGQPVSGVLWDQGQSDANAEAAVHYTSRMKELVGAIRQDLGQRDLPWIIVQAARSFANDNATFWNSIQEQQRQLPRSIPRLVTVVAIDLPMDDWVHIGRRGMPILGSRLARVADRLIHGNLTELPPPDVKSIRWYPVSRHDPERLEITFKNVVGGLRPDLDSRGFSIVGPNGERKNHMIFAVEPKGNKVILSLFGVLDYTDRLMYGQGLCPDARITDWRGMAIPVFGPLPFTTIPGVTPYVSSWRPSEIVPARQPLDKIPCPKDSLFSSEPRNYPEFFINEHSAWENRSGHAFYLTRIKVKERMSVNFRMGYDGPFRLWLDGKSFFCDMTGINPAFADQFIHPAILEAGTHTIVVGMDINDGRAWGFFLRFNRTDGAKTGSLILLEWSTTK